MALSANLREIQKRLREAANTGGAGAALGQQQQAQQLAQAKSGKAGGGGGPKVSGLAAQSVGSELQQAAGEQALQGAAQAAQLGQQATMQEQGLEAARERLAAQKRMAESGMAVEGAMAREKMSADAERAKMQLSANEEMKVEQMSSQFQQRVADLASERGMAVDNIFSEFDRSNKQLEFRKDAAQLEQMAFDLDMANQELLREYNAIWQTQNLADDLTFKKEFSKIQMGEATRSMLEQLGWQKAADADARAFQEQMAQMDINQAIAIADASLKDSQRQMIASGIIQGAQAAAAYDWKSTAPAKEVPLSGVTTTQQLSEVKQPIGDINTGDMGSMA